MKTIMLFILFCFIAFAQTDTLETHYNGNAEYRLVAIHEIPLGVKFNNLRFGFMLSEDSTILPAGKIVKRNRWVKWVTQFVNPQRNNAYFYISTIIDTVNSDTLYLKELRFDSDDNYYVRKWKRKLNKINYPFIWKDLPKRIKVSVGDTLKLKVKTKGKNLNYQWFRRKRFIKDSTAIYDSLGNVVNWTYHYGWRKAIAVTGATQRVFSKAINSDRWNGWKVFCEVYNNLGNMRTRQAVIRIK